MTIVANDTTLHSNMGGNNHTHCLESAMRTAEKLCKTRGVRLTDSRRRVYELILREHSAVKAYDLIKQFEPDKHTNPPTIYRALDFLIEVGLIHKVESLNAFIVCTDPGHPNRYGLQILVCDKCQSVEEVHNSDPMKQIVDNVEEKGFQVSHPVLEIHGRCINCIQ